MRIEEIDGSMRVTINPGEYFSTGDPAVITTLLGSCIAACLYDPVHRLIGMNHFMLSTPRYARDLPILISEAGRYGSYAMDLLINDMMAKGTNRRLLRAKIFGGATIINNNHGGNFYCVGEVNCKFIREYLRIENIPIDAEDLGGNYGRVIHFSNSDFSIYRRKVRHSKSERLLQRDRNCWQKDIATREKEPPQVDIW
jgi:chemotaxis protein CheD